MLLSKANVLDDAKTLFAGIFYEILNETWSFLRALIAAAKLKNVTISLH